jgi:hypothetical protein
MQGETKKAKMGKRGKNSWSFLPLLAFLVSASPGVSDE